MKILVLSPYTASPPRSGAERRLEGLLAGLARKGHRVTLLALAPEGASDRTLRESHSYLEELVVVRYDGRGAQRAKRWTQLRSLFSTTSFEERAYFHRAFAERLSRLVSENVYDVIQYEHAQMACYRLPERKDGEPLFVLDEHNIEYELLERTADAETSFLRSSYARLNGKKLKREERAAWSAFDGVVLTSERDEEVVKESRLAPRTCVVPNGVDLGAFSPRSRTADARTLLFFGALDYRPNEEGMLYFLEEIFPRVAARDPAAQVIVVGRNPTAELLRFASARVHFRGFVDDPREELHAASVVIAPLRIGGGTRFKIVEAMAAGKAIVSTTVGAEGLGIEDRKNIRLADDPEAFAKSIVELLEDAEERSRLGAGARAHAVAHFGWDAAVARLEALYDVCISVRRDGRGA